MSNKSFCDKCGCEVPIVKTDDWGVTTKNTLMLTVREESGKDRKSFDLCDECVKRFESWIKESPIVNIGQPYSIFVAPNTWDGRNVINCLGDSRTYCTAVSGRMSGKETNLSNVAQTPKFTTP